MVGEIYYLSSLESTRFETVRQCRIIDVLNFDTGKSAAVARIEPPVIGQDFNRSADVDVVILAPRHEGSSIDPVSEFPCFVFIAISKEEHRLQSPIRSDDLEVIGWGELYRTFGDAKGHVFK
jgi:hypothetical protein